MDAGTWTLMCKACDRTFDVELAEGDDVFTALKNPCPHCGTKPAEALTWCRIVDFHLPIKPR
jgi:rRNA maturation endonuclease Nob1